MSKKLFRDTLLASTVIAGMTVFAAPAYAQDQGAPQNPDSPAAGVQSQESAGPAEETSSGDIVVTGTLIKNPNLTASSPVTVVGQEELQLTQTNVAEEILRDIPGTVASIGSAVNNGNGGASFVNLRGLGSNRNIVLLDGVRITPSNTVGRVDLNNIPLALIERTDVLTGGASTTYGADAVSGVVNFITRQDFAGMELAASQQISEKGDGNYFRADLTVGANFDDGRGNAVISVGYQDSDPVYQGDRDFSFASYNSFTGVGGGGSPTAVPTSIFLTSLSSTANQQIDPTTGLFRAQFADFNFNPFNIFQTPFERFNIYGAGHYEVADGLEIYTRGLFTKNTVQTIIAPSGVFGEELLLPLGNPFLPAAARAQLCTAEGLTAAQCANPNTLVTLEAVYRRTPEVGPRISNFETVLFDYRAGLRGGITDTISFDVFGAYGESANTQTLQGYVLRSRLQPALLTTSATTCTPPPGSPAATAACVPINLFGPQGSITPAMANFIEGESTTTNRTSLAQARGLISGDVGAGLPWANDPIGFAVGGEYRKYQASQRADLLAQTPGELGGAGGAAPNINGGFDVYEAFAEVIAPIVQDRPLFDSLTLEAGIRRSHYSVFAPGDPSFNTTTWKVGGQWAPVTGIKFRGNYQRAVRAPNIAELFSPVSTGLTNLAVDPCAGAAPLTNATLRAVCIAQGAPAGVIGSIQNPAAGQANSTAGGNPNILPEKSDSWTVGGVFQPSFVPGLTLTLDYYWIVVNDAITNATPGDVIAACFNNLSTTSAACTTQIRRNPSTGRLSGSSVNTPGLLTPLTNQGRLQTDGIDLTLNYRTDLPFADAKLNLSFAGNYTFNSKFQASPTGLNRECTGFYSVNCASIQPEYSWNQRTTLTFGDVDVSLLWRYISSQEYEPILTNRPFVGTLVGGNLAGRSVDFTRIKAYNYFDLSTRFEVSENFDFTVLVANILDKQPPFLGNTIGSTSFNSGNTYPSTYDALGRNFRVGARLKF